MAGLTVAETEVLRSALDEGGASLRMIKNSLARRVLSGEITDRKQIKMAVKNWRADHERV